MTLASYPRGCQILIADFITYNIGQRRQEWSLVDLQQVILRAILPILSTLVYHWRKHRVRGGHLLVKLVAVWLRYSFICIVTGLADGLA